MDSLCYLLLPNFGKIQDRSKTMSLVKEKKEKLSKDQQKQLRDRQADLEYNSKRRVNLKGLFQKGWEPDRPDWTDVRKLPLPATLKYIGVEQNFYDHPQYGLSHRYLFANSDGQKFSLLNGAKTFADIVDEHVPLNSIVVLDREPRTKKGVWFLDWPE